MLLCEATVWIKLFSCFCDVFYVTQWTVALCPRQISPMGTIKFTLLSKLSYESSHPTFSKSDSSFNSNISVLSLVRFWIWIGWNYNLFSNLILAFLLLWMLSLQNGIKTSHRSPDALGFFPCWQMWCNHAVIYGRIMTTIIFTTSNLLLSRFCPKWGSWKSYKTVKHTLIYAEILFYPVLAMCVAI